jgi:hypothetical protein
MQFAAAQAINATLKDAQTAQRALMRQRFTIRRPDFADRSVKITQFARKDTIEGVLSIAGPANAPSRGDIFTKFETRGVKTPRGDHLAVPQVGTVARPRKNSPAMSPRRVAALPQLRTFVRPFKDGSGLGIFGVRRLAEGFNRATRRNGGTVGKRDARSARPRLLFTLIPQTPIEDLLGFEATVTRTVRQRMAPNFYRELGKALATAR